jgi:LEA14-like dessication related protein
MMRRTPFMLGMSLALLLCACASMLPKLQPPRLTVAGIQIGQSNNLQQQPMQLRLHAVNPNDRAIPIRSITCKLEIENMPFAEGQTEEAFVLPANGEIDFNVDVIANLNSALIALAGGLGNHNVNYRVYGEVHLKGSILHSIPFDQRGRVKF